MPLQIGFMTDKVALDAGFSPRTSVTTCDYHSTNAPY